MWLEYEIFLGCDAALATAGGTQEPKVPLVLLAAGMGTGHWNVDLAILNGFKGIVCWRMFALLWFAFCWRGQFNFLLM